MRIGVLTGGGDCPGLNAVIRAIVRKGINAHSHEFVGFRYGWAGVLKNEAVELTLESTRGILHRGGTILGSSRTNPYKVDGGVDQVRASMEARGADAILIPERPFDVDEVCAHIRRRHANGSTFSIVVVAEGATRADGDVISEHQQTDAFGHVRLGGIAVELEKEIEARTGYESR